MNLDDMIENEWVEVHPKTGDIVINMEFLASKEKVKNAQIVSLGRDESNRAYPPMNLTVHDDGTYSLYEKDVITWIMALWDFIFINAPNRRPIMYPPFLLTESESLRNAIINKDWDFIDSEFENLTRVK